jgi:hypothetical protein
MLLQAVQPLKSGTACSYPQNPIVLSGYIKHAAVLLIMPLARLNAISIINNNTACRFALCIRWHENNEF